MRERGFGAAPSVVVRFGDNGIQLGRSHTAAVRLAEEEERSSQGIEAEKPLTWEQIKNWAAKDLQTTDDVQGRIQNVQDDLRQLHESARPLAVCATAPEIARKVQELQAAGYSDVIPISLWTERDGMHFAAMTPAQMEAAAQSEEFFPYMTAYPTANTIGKIPPSFRSRIHVKRQALSAAQDGKLILSERDAERITYRFAANDELNQSWLGREERLPQTVDSPAEKSRRTLYRGQDTAVKELLNESRIPSIEGQLNMDVKGELRRLPEAARPLAIAIDAPEIIATVNQLRAAGFPDVMPVSFRTSLGIRFGAMTPEKMEAAAQIQGYFPFLTVYPTSRNIDKIPASFRERVHMKLPKSMAGKPAAAAQDNGPMARVQAISSQATENKTPQELYGLYESMHSLVGQIKLQTRKLSTSRKPEADEQHMQFAKALKTAEIERDRIHRLWFKRRFSEWLADFEKTGYTARFISNIQPLFKGALQQYPEFMQDPELAPIIQRLEAAFNGYEKGSGADIFRHITEKKRQNRLRLQNENPSEESGVAEEHSATARTRRLRRVTAEELQQSFNPITSEQRNPSDLTTPVEKARNTDLEYRNLGNQFGQSKKNFYKPNPKSQENARIISELLPPAARPVNIFHETEQAITALKSLRQRGVAAYLVTMTLPGDGAFAIMTPPAMSAAAKLNPFPFRSLYMLTEEDGSAIPPAFVSRLDSAPVMLKNRLPRRDMGEDISDTSLWWSPHVNAESDASRLEALFKHLNGRYKALLEHRRAYEAAGNVKGMRVVEKSLLRYKIEMEKIFDLWKAQRDRGSRPS